VNDAIEQAAAGSARQRLGADLRQVLSAKPDWETFARARPNTANRVGLLACGEPAVALAALPARLHPRQRSTTVRRAFLRTAPSELVKFLLRRPSGTPSARPVV